MIRLFFILITLFAVERVVSKRINTYKIKKVKTLIHQINNQYKYLFKGKSEYINFYQWLILFISQAFVVYALVRYIVKKIFRYVEENYILFGKTLTIIVLILFLYFVIGYLLLSISKIYKFLYKIEDKVTKTDLLISYFIISMYMTILILFPNKFSEIYKIGLVGVGISYILNLKVLISVIRSPQIIEVKINNNSKVEENDVGLISGILLFMVIVSLYLGVCFISNGSIKAYSNNPTYYDLFYYTIITFSTIGYGDICPVSIVAKFMSIVISLTSIICLTIFISSMLSYKSEK